MNADLVQDIRAVLELPRDHQLQAVRKLIARLPPVDLNEAWNTAFGPGSLFEAWTATSVATALYAANEAVLRSWLEKRINWVVIEVGAGDGRLWRQLLRPEDRGTLVVVDPEEDAIDQVRQAVGPGVEVVPCVGRVQDVALPAADAIVCSLTLHHVAGTDATERCAHGLEGPGKLEVLRAFRDALAVRRGRLVLVEADIFCDLDLRSGTPELAENLLDSYVRRCARSILDDIDAADDPAMADRWRAIVRHWCVEQVRLADVPAIERDVYELTVDRWLALLDLAGLRVVVHRFTDALPLFHQYVAVPQTLPPTPERRE